MAHIAFDGAQGRIEVTGYLGVEGTRERAISFWMRTTATDGTICWWGDDLTGEVVDGEQNRVRLFHGRVQLFGRGSFLETASELSDGSWHHVVFTWNVKNQIFGHEDFSRANVYVDNVLDNGRVRGGAQLKIREDGLERTDIAVRTPQEQFVVIGARPTSSGTFTEFYQGDLDDFAIYRDDLQPSTVSGIYNGGSPGVDLLSLGQGSALELWYLMGDGAGDSAPNGTVFNQQPFDAGRDGTTSSGTSIV
jgi:hypothetical protein